MLATTVTESCLGLVGTNRNEKHVHVETTRLS